MTGIVRNLNSISKSSSMTLTRSGAVFSRAHFVAGGGAAAAWAGSGTLATPASAQTASGQPTYHYLPANADTVHWGYFSKILKPLIEVESGDFVTIETVTHHAEDDAERMVKGDPGVESIFYWDQDAEGRQPPRRRADGRHRCSGAAPAKASACTSARGRSTSRGAEPGDILEVRILDVKPRPCANPAVHGQGFGSNAAAWWGFHYNDLIDRAEAARGDHDLRGRRHRRAQLGQGASTTSAGRRRPIRSASCTRSSTIPACPSITHGQGELRHPQERAHPDPAAFRRDGPRAQGSRHRRLDPAELYRRQHRQLAHRQGRDHVLSGRRAGRAVLGRRSARLAGRFRAVRHRDRMLADRHLPAHPAQEGDARRARSLDELDYPLLETQDEWVRARLQLRRTISPSSGPKAQSEIYEKSSIDLALRDAFRKMRHFLMTTQGLTEDEAISLMSVGVDFGVTQVVDGNWGVHAIIKKSLFAGTEA